MQLFNNIITLTIISIVHGKLLSFTWRDNLCDITYLKKQVLSNTFSCGSGDWLNSEDQNRFPYLNGKNDKFDMWKQVCSRACFEYNNETIHTPLNRPLCRSFVKINTGETNNKGYYPRFQCRLQSCVPDYRTIRTGKKVPKAPKAAYVDNGDTCAIKFDGKYNKMLKIKHKTAEFKHYNTQCHIKYENKPHKNFICPKSWGTTSTGEFKNGIGDKGDKWKEKCAKKCFEHNKHALNKQDICRSFVKINYGTVNKHGVYTSFDCRLQNCSVTDDNKIIDKPNSKHWRVGYIKKDNDCGYNDVLSVNSIFQEAPRRKIKRRRRKIKRRKITKSPTTSPTTSSPTTSPSFDQSFRFLQDETSTPTLSPSHVEYEQFVEYEYEYEYEDEPFSNNAAEYERDNKSYNHYEIISYSTVLSSFAILGLIVIFGLCFFKRNGYSRVNTNQNTNQNRNNFLLTFKTLFGF